MTTRETYKQACRLIRILRNKPSACNEIIARELLEDIYNDDPVVWFAAHASRKFDGDIYMWKSSTNYATWITLKTLIVAQVALAEVREGKHDLG